MKSIFFSTPTCIKCAKAKEFLAEKIQDIEHIDASTPDGLSKAQEMGVSSVPTVFFFDEETQLGVATDIDEMESILKK